MNARGRLHLSITAGLALALAVLLAGPATTHAAFISEYFDYGDTDTVLSGKGSATDGWGEAWQEDVGETWAAGYSTVNLTYTASGYENTGNESTTGSATSPNEPVYRSFDSGMTGTIWASVLLRTGWYNHLARFDIDGGGMLYKDGYMKAVYNGTSTNIEEVGFDLHLVLMKVEMNVSGGANDTLSLWIDPDLTGGESGLGAADHTGSGADAFGPTFDTAYVKAGQSGKVDALRISDDVDNGFTFVTTGVIPEPGTLALLGLGGLGVVFRRRRRA